MTAKHHFEFYRLLAITYDRLSEIQAEGGPTSAAAIRAADSSDAVVPTAASLLTTSAAAIRAADLEGDAVDLAGADPNNICGSDQGCRPELALWPSST